MRAVMWIALLCMCGVFFVGMVWLAMTVPLLAVFVAGLLGYVLVAMAMEASKL